MKQFFKENFGKLKDIVSNNFEKEIEYTNHIKNIIDIYTKYNKENIENEIPKSKYFDIDKSILKYNNGFFF